MSHQKPGKGGKQGAADKKKEPEAKPSDETAGMVQGLAQETVRDRLPAIFLSVLKFSFTS